MMNQLKDKGGPWSESFCFVLSAATSYAELFHSYLSYHVCVPIANTHALMGGLFVYVGKLIFMFDSRRKTRSKVCGYMIIGVKVYNIPGTSIISARL